MIASGIKFSAQSAELGFVPLQVGMKLIRLATGDYPLMARRIAELGLPTLVVMEGGYALDALGDNVAAFLSGF